MTSQLLKVYAWDMDMTGKVPLFMEFQVDPRVSPFLVTSTSSFLWVSRTRSGNLVRAAVRDPGGSIESFYKEIVHEVVEKGIKSRWGNVQPLTPKGIEDAITHVTSYGFDEIDILVHPTLPVDFDVPKNALVYHVEWLDEGYLIVLPRDRDFVGFVASVSGMAVSVVHNAARGIAVARITNEELAEKSSGDSDPE